MIPRQILLVEDNPIDAKIVQVWLGRFTHWTLTTVGSLAEAKVKIKEFYFDAILLDLHLPDSDGIEGVEVIRDASPNSALVILTSTESLDSVVGSLRLGADDYLSKSKLSSDVLEKTLRYAINKRKGEQELQQLRTKQERTSHAHHKEYLKFRGLFENAFDGIILTTKEYQCVDANPSACRIFNMDLGDLLKQKITDLIGVDLFSQTSENSKMTTSIQNNQVIEFSQSLGVLPGLNLYILRDVTDQSKMKEERDRFFDVAVDLICVADHNGYFTRMNPACISILGYTPQEMCERPFTDFVHKDDLKLTAKVLDDCGAGAPVYAFENRYRHKNGSYVRLSWRSVTVGDRIYATARDNTERDRMQAQLLHADRMVAVGTLAAGIAHEINNPLSYNLLNLEIALDTLSTKAPLTVEQTLHLKEVLSLSMVGANRVKEIVAGLKVFSRNDEQQVGPMKIESVLDLAIQMAMHEIQPRARIVKHYAPVPLVLGNEGRLGQVFVNLLVNAAHSIKEGSADANCIAITTKTDANGKVCIEITDTGSGIPDDIKTRIFDPFFTTKAVGTGTGLGLSICHGIVTALSGKIEIDSEVGRGTTVRIVLPATLQNIIEILPEVPRRQSTTPRLKVLIIDDEPDFASTLYQVLGRTNEATAESDSRVALNLILKNADYDLILCDLMMPGFTGMDIYEKLKADNRKLEERVIFMTGGAFTPKAVAFLQDPNIRHIGKPFKIQALLKMIKPALAS